MLAWAPVLGRVLAQKYRLDAEIGAGAMGRVYRARQLDLARDVAVKILHPLMAADEGAKLRFAREAKVAARLNHPAAVSVLDYGIDDDGNLPYLVMELMHGETLRERITRMPLTRHDALAVASDVADALIAAHEIRLIHRDIKPENTFLQRTPSGERVRVVDFGLAFLATEEVAVGRMTQDGFVGGTPAYMAPEQVHGRGVGPAADIYGLGCMLYELIAGHPPFRGTLAELLTSQAYAPPRPMRLLSLNPPVPPELDRLVLSMLSKSAPLRPGPSAVWQGLRDIMADLPSRATAPSYISARSARVLGRIAPPVAGTMNAAAMRSIAQGSGLALPGDAAAKLGVKMIGGAAGTNRAGAEAERDDQDHSRDATLGASSAPNTTKLSGVVEQETLDGIPPPTVLVIALGELSDDLELGLIAAGCAVEKEPPDAGPAVLQGADVIWAPGASDARVTELAAFAPVVTDLLSGAAEATSIEGLMQRLRAGAADLVMEEATPDQLARKLIRAVRRPKASEAENEAKTEAAAKTEEKAS